MSDPPYVTCVARVQAGAYSAFPNIGFRCAVSVSSIKTLFNPELAKPEQQPLASGVTVISEKGTGAESITSLVKGATHTSRRTTNFKPVRYFRELDFDGKRCVGHKEISKASRSGAPYWKVYYQAPGIITQAQYYSKTDNLQFYIEPTYDEQGREKEVKLYNQEGILVYRSKRVYSKDGRPVKGILYSVSGDYIGEEKF